MFVSKRKYGRLSLLLGSVITYFLIPTAFGQIFHLPSQMPVGNSDMNGFARLDREFYEMPLGNDQSTRLFFRFSTDPRQEPKYMGAYWSIPFFDSQISKTANNKYRWITPNLQTYTFNKIQKPDKGYKETYILNTNGSWKLHLTRNNDFLIESTEDTANRYTFKKDKLVAFCNGTKADLFKIFYNNKGAPISVYNANKNTTEMEFTYGKEGLLVKIGFPKNKKALLIAYDTCDTFAEDGTKQGKFLKSVSSITFEDGIKEKYKYSSETEEYDSKRLKKSNLNKIEQKIGRYEEIEYIKWDAQTGTIVSDSGGIYTVKKPLTIQVDSATQYSFPQEIEITYKKPEFKYDKIWSYDTKKAIKTIQDPLTGEQTRTYYIGGFGKASMEVRKVEKKPLNKNNWTTEVAKIYNEEGKLIREIYSNGEIKNIQYKDGIEKHFLNGKLIKLIKREKNRTSVSTYSDNNETLIELIETPNQIKYLDKTKEYNTITIYDKKERTYTSQIYGDIYDIREKTADGYVRRIKLTPSQNEIQIYYDNNMNIKSTNKYKLK